MGKSRSSYTKYFADYGDENSRQGRNTKHSHNKKSENESFTNDSDNSYNEENWSGRKSSLGLPSYDSTEAHKSRR